MSDDDDYYQDDFEDYEDDFEDDEPEIEVPFPNTQLSLGRRSTDGQRPTTSSLQVPAPAVDIQSRSTKPQGPPQKGYLPTKAALGPSDAQLAILQQRSARWKLLMPRIQLQVMEWDNVFEMPPMTLYDLYTRGLGQYATLRVASTQTGDDCHTEEIQTDEIDLVDRRCQVPDDAGKSSWELQQRDTDIKPASKGKHKQKKNAMADLTLDDGNSKYSGFIKKAAAMVCAILSGEQHATLPSISFPSSWCFSGITDGSLILDGGQWTPGGSIISLTLATGLQPLLLVAHGLSNDDLAKMQHGCLSVWSLNDCNKLVAILVTEGTPSCCCWSPGNVQRFAFAGMQEGGVCLWDLQELDGILANHHTNSQASGIKTLRAAYTTEYSPDHDTAAPVTSMFACNAHRSALDAMVEGDIKKWSSPNDGGNIELVCLSAWGCVTIMAVKELNDMDAFSLQQIDWGLRIGARAQLVKVTTGIPLGKSVLLNKAGMSPSEEQPATCMVPLPGSSSQFLVGSDGGRILRGAKLGDIAAPKQFAPFDDTSRIKHQSTNHFTSSVTALDASPNVDGLFVAGHTDSLITLHHLHKEGAVRSWEGLARGDVVFVKFLPRSASMVLALFSSSELCCIDLLGEGLGLVCKVSVEKNGVGVTACDLMDRGEAVENECVTFAIGYEDGDIQVHRIAHGLAKGHLATEADVLSCIRV